MQRLGPGGLFWFVAAGQILTVATALFRLWRAEVPEATRGNVVAVGHGATAMAAHLNPDAPFRETGVNEDS